MAEVKNVRVSDRNDFASAKKSEFVARKHIPFKQITRLLIMLVIVVLGVAVLVYYNSLVGCWLASGVGLVILYVARKLEKLEKIQHSTEFMNALFSSALGKKYKFCTVINLAGEIVYLNRSFQAMFPAFVQQSERTLDKLLSMQNVAADRTDMVKKLIEQNSESSLAVIMDAGAEKAPESVTLYIEPIERPSGFVLIRGQ
jgi:hypothetical protein